MNQQDKKSASADHIADARKMTSTNKPGDILKRLREYIANLDCNHNDYADTMCADGDEIERYYGELLAWNATAEARDRKFSQQAKPPALSAEQFAISHIPSRGGEFYLASNIENHAALAIPNGWTLDRTNSGDILVRKAGIGGCVSSAHSDNIASLILHELAADLLAAASGCAECRAYQGNQEKR